MLWPFFPSLSPEALGSAHPYMTGLNGRLLTPALFLTDMVGCLRGSWGENCPSRCAAP